MDKLYWIFGVSLIIVGAMAAILISRRKTRRIMERLSAMLDSAAGGHFAESTYDESLLSAVEEKMSRFLSSCAVSSQNLTEEKNKIKSLISDISHQTKTPVANILLYSQLLSEMELPEDCADCVAALSAQAEKLNFLIQALVKASRLETGIIRVAVKKQPVAQLLEAAVAQIGPKSKAREISLDLEPTQEAACYDPKWTAEAVYNILDNAVKYSPPQSRIRIRVIPGELFCRVDIADEGIGIAEEEQSRIFLRFYRSPAVSGQEGVGIGLFLAREIVSSGGGYIKVSSEPGKGSVFSVFLPAEQK